MRASRLLSILIALQLRGRVTAQALAEEFEVSVRTVYRDIDALSMAGIPVYGDCGPGGGFQLIEGYQTRLTGLSPEEAEALLLIGMPDEAGALGLGPATRRARGKVLATLSQATKGVADRLVDRFHLDTAEWYRSKRPVPFLAQVARAVLDLRELTIGYQSWTARRQWRVEPWGIVQKAGQWYLVASGHGKTRIFNIADIYALEVNSESCVVPADFDLAQWWHNAIDKFEERLRPGRAELRLSPIGLQRLRLLGDFAGRAIAAASPPDIEGWTRLTLPVESLDAAAPMILGIGPEVDVIEPPELREAVRDLAVAVANRIDDPANGQLGAH
jgi:predicted DNA-binding transcriptional regulator YafY